MDQPNPLYSVLVYTFDLTDEVIAQVRDWVLSGVKVYLFTSDFLDPIEENEEFQQWRKNYFIQWFTVPFREEDQGQVRIFVDGKINEPNLYQFLVEKAENQGFYSFNPEQFRVEHAPVDQHLFVMAGAGTGKTTVMVNRLLYLKHVVPDFQLSKVAMITFTNEAASVMRRTLQKRMKAYYELTGNPKYLRWLDEVGEAKISTIHSFAKHIFETEGRELGFSSQIKIRNFHQERRRLVEEWLDRFAQENEEIYQTFAQVPHYVLVRSILNLMAHLENHSLHETVYHSLDFGEDDQQFQHLLQYVVIHSMEELQEMKDELQSYEVNDLIRKLYEIQYASHFQFQQRFHTIMVDEFQDTDYIQVQFLLWLQQSLSCRLMVVGDVKQSIYRFRGADYTAFEQLEKGLSGQEVQKINLVKNYRSSPKLLESFEPIFRLWGERIDGFPYTDADQLKAMSTNPVGGIQFPETDLVVEWRRRLLDLEGKDTAILVRRNKDIQLVVEQCEEWGIDCVGQIQGQFFRTLPVREVYFMIRYLLFPRSASTIWALHQSSFGEQTMLTQEFVQKYPLQRKGFQSIWEQQPDYPIWEEYRKQALHVPPLQLIEQIIRERQPAKRYAQQCWKLGLQDRELEEIERLKQQCQKRMYQYQSRLEKLLFLLKKHFSDSTATLMGIERYLRIQIQTNTEVDDDPVSEWGSQTQKPIHCMTVHKSKGQEFDHVVLPLLDHVFNAPARPQIFVKLDQIPPKVAYKLDLENYRVSNQHYEELRRQEQRELIAEETRLLYVALTRAKEMVHIAQPKVCNNQPNSWGELLGWRVLAHV